MSEKLLNVIPANAGIHPLPRSTVLDPGPVSSTGWHFRRDDSCSGSCMFAPGRFAPAPRGGEQPSWGGPATVAQTARGRAEPARPSKQVDNSISMICSSLWLPLALSRLSTGSQARAKSV